ncbi:hypothetical protein FHC47_20880 [Klebsiella quasipneumoniae]|nr:hypothetical protein F1D92_24865 [Klebsiella pneumoniae]TNC54085.1 hypothetical protein FHC47_20880 [Klebsiella quasipneumoniae]MBQ5042715.1 hypothetical protein [Klebsiella pneumoniae]QAT12481.1 hypothetical protein CAK82_29555 [Klebsiella pneumoniae]HBY2491696.1 hypothetical protein [Klebsiella pneumoniae]
MSRRLSGSLAFAFRFSTALSPQIVDRYVDTPPSPDVAEGLPPAASVSRPACYGTGGFSAQARRR